MKLVSVMAAALLVLGTAQAQEATEEAPVQPQRLTAQALVNACAASRLSGGGRLKRRFCDGYVSGVEEAARLLPQLQQMDALCCASPDITARQLSEAFLRYAGRLDKAALQKPAAEVVVDALRAAYPCEDEQ